jgi:hypothetical protein
VSKSAPEVDFKKRAKSGLQKSRQKWTSKSAPNHGEPDIKVQGDQNGWFFANWTTFWGLLWFFERMN